MASALPLLGAPAIVANLSSTATLPDLKLLPWYQGQGSGAASPRHVRIMPLNQARNGHAWLRRRQAGPLRPEVNARCGLPPLLLCLTCAVPSVDVRWCQPSLLLSWLLTGSGAPPASDPQTVPRMLTACVYVF
jgi:hypothetical protein